MGFILQFNISCMSPSPSPAPLDHKNHSFANEQQECRHEDEEECNNVHGMFNENILFCQHGILQERNVRIAKDVIYPPHGSLQRMLLLIPEVLGSQLGILPIFGVLCNLQYGRS